MEVDDGDRVSGDPAVVLAQICDTVTNLMIGFSEKGEVSFDICEKGIVK